ncbi:MAG: EscU/YscU/HrcU family type III secretion system export apparatus switch protein [Candidatus Eremiobacteraeota bacterium]|nr:EscU/YscU/HrcU family type III secretion system export apparatus switch protein [Candidatus Eremiobacteraeota bacterium]
MPFPSVAAAAATTLAGLWWRIVAVAGLIAVADVALQRRRFTTKLRMTPREVRDERIETDGKPETKARRRAVGARRVRALSIAAIRRATAVVTNPTHVAVALRYAPPRLDVPVVVARGAGLAAGMVRAAAEMHDVPIMESPDLARALYARVDVDGPIPEECYVAVAAVFAWILRTRGRLGGAEEASPR